MKGFGITVIIGFLLLLVSVGAQSGTTVSPEPDVAPHCATYRYLGKPYCLGVSTKTIAGGLYKGLTRLYGDLERQVGDSGVLEEGVSLTTRIGAYKIELAVEVSDNDHPLSIPVLREAMKALYANAITAGTQLAEYSYAVIGQTSDYNSAIAGGIQIMLYIDKTELKKRATFDKRDTFGISCYNEAEADYGLCSHH